MEIGMEIEDGEEQRGRGGAGRRYLLACLLLERREALLPRVDPFVPDWTWRGEGGELGGR